jgi:hypothetical protein
VTPHEAAKLLNLTVDEAIANAEFMEAAAQYIDASAPHMYAHAGGTPAADLLQPLFALRKKPRESAFRGLIVQIVAAHEVYIANICACLFECIKTRINDNDVDIDAVFRAKYLAKAGAVLTHLPSGTFRGARFDFAALEQNLPSVLLQTRPIDFQSAVLSTRLGACDSEKIDGVLSFFGLETPFRKELGAHKATVDWRSGTSSPTAAAGLIKNELDDLIRLRNDIAHGDLRDVSIDIVKGAGKLVSAFGKALADLISGRP